MKAKFKVGDIIKVVDSIDSSLIGIEGKITKHPYPGMYFGTWGDKPLFSACDYFEKVSKE